jgi:hypothetical protein
MQFPLSNVWVSIQTTIRVNILPFLFATAEQIKHTKRRRRGGKKGKPEFFKFISK